TVDVGCFLVNTIRLIIMQLHATESVTDLPLRMGLTRWSSFATLRTSFRSVNLGTQGYTADPVYPKKEI
ncbi:MAG: hypothetical protein VCC01_14155, partial [Candidatus Hydrogenedentota bacterium]